MTDKQIFKRIFDIIAVVLFMIPIGPVMLIVVAILKLTYKNNVFFLQERIGKEGEVFKM